MIPIRSASSDLYIALYFIEAVENESPEGGIFLLFTPSFFVFLTQMRSMHDLGGLLRNGFELIAVGAFYQCGRFSAWRGLVENIGLTVNSAESQVAE